MGAKIDYTGKRFGRLVAIRFSRRINKRTYWFFCCDCGTEKEIRADGVTGKRVESCGCLSRERAADSCVRTRTIHGDAKKRGADGVGRGITRLHGIWDGMKARCLNKNRPAYKNYGGRGIKVCEEWQSDYLAFKAWALANGYADNLTIDRIDNDGNYEPSNCQWLSKSENSIKARTQKEGNVNDSR